MKKFHFKLEKVLKHKLLLFERSQERHAAALQRLRQEEMKLDSLRDTYKNCLFELSGKTVNTFRVRDLGPYYRYLSFIKGEISAQARVVVQSLEDEKARRQELLAAAQEKEALVKLKEKKMTEYNYETLKEEQKFLDDITSSKYSRSLAS